MLRDRQDGSRPARYRLRDDLGQRWQEATLSLGGLEKLAPCEDMFAEEVECLSVHRWPGRLHQVERQGVARVVVCMEQPQ